MEIKVGWPLFFIFLLIITCVQIFHSEKSLADLLLDSGRFDQAIGKYRQLLQADPQRKDIQTKLLQVYMAKGQPDSVLSLFERAGGDLPLDSQRLESLAGIYSQKGDRSNTLKIMQRLATVDSANWQTQVKLADAYVWSGDGVGAVRIYQKLLIRQPENLDIICKLLSVYLSRKEFTFARNHLEAIRSLAPRDVESRALLGHIYIETGDKEKAGLEFEEVLKLTPENTALRNKLAELYLWIGEYEKGVTHYEILLSKDPQNEVCFNKLVEATERRDPGRTMAHFKKRLQQFPKNIALRIRFVELLDYYGYTDLAINQARDIVAQRPEEPKYYFQLATLFAQTHQPQKATEIYEVMFAKNWLDNEVIYELTRVYLDEKRFSKLRKLYETLIAQGVAGETQEIAYCQLLLAMHENQAAANHYTHLVEKYPANMNHRLALAKLYQLLRQEDKTLAVLRTGVAQTDQTHEQFQSYAAAYFVNRKLLDEGIFCYEKLAALNNQSLSAYQTVLIDLYAKTGDLKQAFALNRRVIKTQPNNLSAKFSLARLYWMKNRFKKMHQVILQIRKQHSAEGDLNKQIGEFYVERKFLDHGIAAIRRHLSQNPKDTDSLKMLGLAYAWNSQPAPAERILRHYHEQNPYDYYTHFQLAEILTSQGEHDAARGEFVRSYKLLKTAPQTTETEIIRAKTLANIDFPEKAVTVFETLIAEHPGDISIHAEYADMLVKLKQHQKADEVLQVILQQQPGDYRALRLLANNSLQQKDYSRAASILKKMNRIYKQDAALAFDLADTELNSGDWVAGRNTLGTILSKTPDYLPAAERLTYLQRVRPQGVATEYRYNNQGNNIFRKAVEVTWAKAYASWLSFKTLLTRESYADTNFVLTEKMTLELSSVLSRNVQTSVSASAQKSGDNWYLSGKTNLQLNLTPGNSIRLTGELNRLWTDPLAAAFYSGRLNHFSYNLNLQPWNRFFLWNQISYETHRTELSGAFGNAYRTYLQLGYQWFDRPQLSTYYQLYHLKYSYVRDENRLILSIPDRETVHSFGLGLSQQLTRSFYYELGGNIGFNKGRDSFQYHNSIELEYAIRNYLRFNTKFEFGSQSSLTGANSSRALRFGFWYHY